MPETTTSNRDRKVWDDLRKENRARDRKLNKIETHEYSLIRMINNSINDRLLNAVALPGAAVYTTAIIRGSYNVPDNATGVFLTVWFSPVSADVEICLASSDEIPDEGSQKLVWLGGVDTSRELVSSFAMVKLGKDGAFNIYPTQDITVSINIVGYWL